MSNTSTNPAIRTKGLRKSYGDKLVLDGIDLDVSEGSVFALLGPNGAGKTTTVQIMTTLISADEGEVWVAGHSLSHDPDSIRASIAVTGQFSAIDNLLTAEENLMLMADLNHLDKEEGRRRTAQLLEQFELVDAAQTTPDTYSGGMVRRLDLAMGLMSDPQVVFLDEPTTGLDPRGRHTMWRIIRNLADEGATIFLTTQYLEEADRLADQVAILDQGRLVADGTSAELKRLTPGGHITLGFSDPQALEAAASVVQVIGRDEAALTLQVPGDDGVDSLRGVLDDLHRESVEVDTLTVHTPDLDDVFFALTGQPITTTTEGEQTS